MKLTRELKYQAIDQANRQLIVRFLENLKEGKSHFRYFEKRPLEIIKNHVYTMVAWKDHALAGYGHLDPEAGDTWLGMAVADDVRGQGIGGRILRHLIQMAKNKSLESLRLSVDEGNAPAIHLYEREGFRLEKKEGHIRFYRLVL